MTFEFGGCAIRYRKYNKIVKSSKWKIAYKYKLTAIQLISSVYTVRKSSKKDTKNRIFEVKNKNIRIFIPINTHCKSNEDVFSKKNETKINESLKKRQRDVQNILPIILCRSISRRFHLHNLFSLLAKL